MSALRRSAGAFVVALAALLLAAPSFAIDPAPPMDDPVLQARYKTLVHELRCLKCQGETIADTPAPFASDLRREIREMLKAGQSDQQIRQFMVDRYGEIILLKPAFSLRNAWLWFAPAIFLVLGGIAAARVLRQRQALLATDDEPVPTDEDVRQS